MIKRIITIFLFVMSFNSFAKTTSFTLPERLSLSSDNPSQYFPSEIQSRFEITADPKSSQCQKNQEYILTLLIYRNAVDNKIAAVYRPTNDNDICWIDLLSYSDQLRPDMTAEGWQAPQNPNENTWCTKSASLCPIMDA